MDYVFDVCLKNRVILNTFLEELSLEKLNTIPEGFRNNVFWNIAHTVVTQELLVYRLSGIKGLVNDDLVDRYRKGTKAEENITEVDVHQIKALLFTTLDQTKKDYFNGKFKTFQEYTLSTKGVLASVEDALYFNSFHEGIHLGYCMALKKLI